MHVNDKVRACSGKHKINKRKGESMDSRQDQISEAGQALSELGAAKGGKARAQKLSPDERREIARHAAEARWADTRKNPPLIRATHEGELGIGKLLLPCAVTEDGIRLLTQYGFLMAIGRSGKPAGGRGSAGRFPRPSP